MLETFLRYHHQQGLLPRRRAPEELFAPEASESFEIWEPFIRGSDGHGEELLERDVEVSRGVGWD